MNTKTIGIWAFLIGLVLALATVFVDLGGWVTQVLIILAMLVGFFHPIREDPTTLGIAYLALVATASSIGELVAIGPYISAIAAAWVGFLGPVVLIAFMFWGSAYLVTKGSS